jgi:hypothetical protein
VESGDISCYLLETGRKIVQFCLLRTALIQILIGGTPSAHNVSGGYYRPLPIKDGISCIGMSPSYPHNCLNMFATRALLIAAFVGLASVSTLAIPADDEGTHIRALDSIRSRDCPQVCFDGYALREIFK